MKTIKYALVNTSGFWSIMNFLKEYVSEEYILSKDSNPDYLICSVFGKSTMKDDAIRIQYIGENLVPDFNIYDYAIGFHFLDFGDRYLRYPIYALAYRDAFLKAIEKHTISEQELQKKDKFCSFVVSNGREEDVRPVILRRNCCRHGRRVRFLFIGGIRKLERNLIRKHLSTVMNMKILSR